MFHISIPAFSTNPKSRRRLTRSDRYYMMMENSIISKSLVACAIGAICIVEVFEENEDDFPRTKEKKKLLDFMMNKLGQSRFNPELPLENRINISDVLRDPARNYCKVLTSLYGWEFFSLADHLKPFIETSRGDINKMQGRVIRFKYFDRLYFTLFWLATGLEYYQLEFFFGWSKSTWECEIQHILKAIIRGLDHFLNWPSVEERKLMEIQHGGIFRGCIGIIDAMEHIITKPKNRSLESSTYSKKKGANTLKTMAVIDRRGRFRFVQTGTHGSINDRDQFTSSVLYLNKNLYFEGEQFLAADGIYRGDGPILVSYNASQLSESIGSGLDDFNISFTEYRKGIENAFGRVQNWFPLLGNQKCKWNLQHYTLDLAVHASVRLHNWLVHIRDLNYDPTIDPSYLFTSNW